MRFEKIDELGYSSFRLRLWNYPSKLRQYPIHRRDIGMDSSLEFKMVYLFF